jgi:hypothetical protein
MGASALLCTLFRYQAWANNEVLEKIGNLDPDLHRQERHTAIRLINHAYVVGRIFAAHLGWCQAQLLLGQHGGYTGAWRSAHGHGGIGSLVSRLSGNGDAGTAV